ncbi:MAG: DUF1501 domain-containing protein [Gammaproteobacteria bacterium]|nr:DUF1501 domain-containing protein [Gammaproteobacteria bacterium]
MNKRNFLKSIAALGGSALLPSSVNPLAMYKTASAAVDYSAATVVAPTVMPQVINIFLYGGPSELSGNLTNMAGIDGIDANSQNSYAAAFNNRILAFDTTGDGVNGFITKNGFWRGEARTDAGNLHLDNGFSAGGRAMQFMLDNKHMSVYRTLMKRLDGTRSHRESLLQSFKGSLDIEGSAGVGTKIAATLFQHRTTFEGSTTLADGTAIGDIVNDLLLPFVSFEGETRAFQQDPNFQIPLLYRGITLDQNFNNPYSRGSNNNEAVLEALANARRTPAYDARYSAAANSFKLRAELESKIGNIQAAGNTTTTPLPVITDPVDIAAANLDPATGRLVYPNNQYRDRVRAAVTLALVNPGSLYITVGGGLGGWDDHNNGIDNYRNRMNDLFETLKAAMLHIKYADVSRGGLLTLEGNTRTTDNIVINMFGDFGRRVNLNGNQGWDHGNNQNLFTFGGARVRAGGGAALGKVVGKTVRVGDPGTNNQVTEPAPGSYEAEPMSVASAVFSYFGVQNPELLTRDDEVNPAGVPVIDETQAAEPDLF